MGFGRSGTGWLARIMGEARCDPLWNEPGIGGLYGEFFENWRGAHKPDTFIMAPSRAHIWLPSIESMTLEGANARFPMFRRGQRLIIKEPWGSIGVPFLSQAMPASSLVFLLRDPRDVTASALDARRSGSWIRAQEAQHGHDEPMLADTDPDSFVKEFSQSYLSGVDAVHRAFLGHRGAKAFLRYEDMRSDPQKALSGMYQELSLRVDGAALSSAIEKFSFERVPAEHRGTGRPFRKATVGGWKEDLTETQIAIVETMTAPILRGFYGGS